MAKIFNSNLPKVISKANRDISLIIENDIASESKLLKNLVNQVLKANLEIKEKNDQRITKTKLKLAELDEQILNLNQSIDLVDRETVIQQLNEMIDAENKIFSARQEIRFFDNDKTPDRLDNLDIIYKDLIFSIQKLNIYEEKFRDSLLNSNTLLFNKQLKITKEIISLMDELFNQKSEYIYTQLEKRKDLSDNIIKLENEFSNYINTNLETCSSIINTSTSIFTDIDDDSNINEKIRFDHEEAITKLNKDLENIKVSYITKKDEINRNYFDYEKSISKKLETENIKLIERERVEQDLINEKLKNTRLKIIYAEKNNNISTARKLMKQFDKIEKSMSLKVGNKLSKELSMITKKTHAKSINQLQTLELKYITDLNKIEYAMILESIKYKEAKILYKIKSDFSSLQKDADINKQRMLNLKDFLDTKILLSKKIYNLKLELRLVELQIMKDNELLEQSLIISFKELLLDLKTVENSRLIVLKENINNHSIIKIEQEFQVKKSIELIKLDQELMDIDKLILKMRNETLIKNEKLKEEANSEIIYLESLINIANKERDLQLIKVKSLYENERNLAEEQIERINLGVKVNDAFIKTTLKNQLLFASQQMKCTESETEIRIESINLTHAQELQYANKKINHYRQKYDYEKGKIKKELDDKLEDLNYKLLLFTDHRDNKEINNKIETLNAKANAMIKQIEKVENEDPDIIRYVKIIEEADNRAKEAINDALALKTQTIDSFKILYDKTEQKYNLIKETDQTEETKGIMPVLNNTAISSATARLEKAILEAETLYKDKISGPIEKIAKTKEKLEKLTNSKESSEFVDEQRKLKKQKIAEHKGLIEQLELEKARALQLIKTELDKVKESNKFEIKNLEANLFKNSKYRNATDIEQDYTILFKNETNKHKTYIENISNFKSVRLKKHEKLLKETNIISKQTFKSYKKYIKFTSKGLNVKKKELTKDYNKKLKKTRNEIQNNYKKLLNSL